MRASLVAAILCLAAVPASATPELVLDLGSGRVLHAHEAQRPWHPASLTKLMTAYVALSAMRDGTLGDDAPVTLTPEAVRLPPSRSGLQAGTRLALIDALRILMVKSANDVAASVAVAVAGSVPAFVERMNATSARLGMTATRWVNPHGLDDPAQVTTARDLAVLASALRRDFPDRDDLFAIGSLRLGRAVFRNHNTALGRIPGVDGMKTGYVCASGFNVVMTAREGSRRVAVVLLGRDGALERDAKASLLARAGLATAGDGIGSLADFRGAAAGAPPRRSCGARNGSEDDGILAGEGAGTWIAGFARLPVREGTALTIEPLPSRAPVPSILAAQAPAARPVSTASVPATTAPEPARAPDRF